MNKQETELFQARQALTRLLETRGDFRVNSVCRGECYLALAALDVARRSEGGNTLMSDAQIIVMLQAAHRALFNA